MNITRILRRFALVFFIALACILPVPIIFHRKDDLPKHLVEQLEDKQEDTEKDNIKELF